MRPRSLSEIARAIGGVQHGEDAVASSVTIDSRTADLGSLFVALPGEHANGHAFVGDALSRGAERSSSVAPAARNPRSSSPTPDARCSRSPPTSGAP
jgi:UDP-N-acetylmuramoyl-tripeptide--D-alanyl-D-alanine ligase